MTWRDVIQAVLFAVNGTLLYWIQLDFRDWRREQKKKGF